MKEKGFTLIELLAVIVILSVITLITVPMITNVIEESKKKALASSVEGLVESANLYAIENDGVYEFLFDKEHKGSTKKGEQLDYRGTIDGEGKLYLDKEGNTSVCISNDTYYVYKNYNSGIIVGERKAGNCIIGFDALTNKYVAMLDNGTGNVSNVYSKDEVNNLVDSLDTKITNNTNEITSMKSNIEELQNNLNNYALQSELEKTNSNLNNLSGIVKANASIINNYSDLQKLSITKVTNSYANLHDYSYAYIKNDICYLQVIANGQATYAGWAKIATIPIKLDTDNLEVFNGLVDASSNVNGSGAILRVTTDGSIYIIPTGSNGSVYYGNITFPCKTR